VNVEAFVKLAEFRSHAVLAVSTPLLLMCADLCNDLQYDRALALATGETGWEGRWDTQLAVGIIHHRRRAYSDARTHYQLAAALAPPARAATCVANIGTTWFEEGELGEAAAAYQRALQISDEGALPLLGLLAIACHQQDTTAVEDAFTRLVQQHPRWRSDFTVQHNLLQDNSFRYLRQLHPELA
jgi:tetratricopeptide (TPR) repeat protein